VNDHPERTNDAMAEQPIPEQSPGARPTQERAPADQPASGPAATGAHHEPTSDLVADAYRDLRARVITIAETIDEPGGGAPVPCCPAWTVLDLLAHLAGVPDDILTGRLDGVTTDAWTDAQVAARRGRSLAELVAEFDEKGTAVEHLLRAGATFPPPFFIDAWTHEWDLRQAVGAATVPDFAMLATALGGLVRSFAKRLDTAGAAPVDLTIDGATQRLGSGAGEPVALTLDTFTFVRAALGRRSRAQLEALPWGPGVTAEHVDALVVFGIADHDVVDPVLPA
jgi:uncharacterized protein (TIGR03083 family)